MRVLAYTRMHTHIHTHIPCTTYDTVRQTYIIRRTLYVKRTLYVVQPLLCPSTDYHLHEVNLTTPHFVYEDDFGFGGIIEALLVAFLFCTLYTLYTVHCILYTIHCTLFILHCKMRGVQYTLYNVHCTVYTVQYTLFIVHYSLYIVQ